MSKIRNTQTHNRHDNDSETHDRQRLDNTVDKTPVHNN